MERTTNLSFKIGDRIHLQKTEVAGYNGEVIFRTAIVYEHH